MARYIELDTLIEGIERRIYEIDKYYCDVNCAQQRIEECERFLSFLDTLKIKEVQEELVSEDLEEAASWYAEEEYNHKNHATLPDRCRACYAPLMYAFKAGAKWKEEQM